MSTAKLLNAAFLLALWTPLVAAMVSDRFTHFVRAVAEDRSRYDSEREALRRSTPLWNTAVQHYNRLLFALGTTPNRDVAIVGGDGWIFLGDIFEASFSQAIGRRTMDDAHLERWSRMLTHQERWLGERGIGFAFVVAPAKWSVYPEKLPDWASRTATHPFDRLFAARPVTAMPDLRPALRDARARGDTFAPMNSHWTEFGGWIAWQQIAGELERAMPAQGPYVVPPLRGTRIENSNNEFAGLLSLPLASPWTRIELASSLPDYVIVNADGSGQQVGGELATDLLDLPRQTVTAKAANPRRVLWLRDSSGNSLSPFIQSNFGAILQVDHALAFPDKSADLKALVERYQPDLVIWVIAERYLLSPIPEDAAWLSPTTQATTPTPATSH